MAYITVMILQFTLCTSRGNVINKRDNYNDASLYDANKCARLSQVADIITACSVYRLSCGFDSGPEKICSLHETFVSFDNQPTDWPTVATPDWCQLFHALSHPQCPFGWDLAAAASSFSRCHLRRPLQSLAQIWGHRILLRQRNYIISKLLSYCSI